MAMVCDLWESFASRVIPPTATEVQYTECRRAFYAGAWAMLMACSGLGDDAVSEDAGVDQLESWRRELEAFSADVQAGRA